MASQQLLKINYYLVVGLLTILAGKVVVGTPKFSIPACQEDCTQVSVGEEHDKQNIRMDLPEIYLDSVTKLVSMPKFRHLQCLIVKMFSPDKTSIQDVDQYLKWNRAPCKALVIETFNSSHIQPNKSVHFDTYYKMANEAKTWVKCKLSKTVHIHLKNINTCDKNPYWKDRRIRAAGAKSMTPPPVITKFKQIMTAMRLDYELSLFGSIKAFSGAVASGKADIGIQHSFASHIRYQKSDILHVDSMARLVWAMPHPKPITDNYNGLLTVFDFRVWVTLLGTITLGFVVLVMLSPLKLSLYQYFTVVLTAFINEPVPNNRFKRFTENSAMFSFCFTWILMAHCLNMAYKANLLVNILALRYEDKFDTSRQVLDSGLPLWIPAGGQFLAVFRNNPNPIINAIKESNLAIGGKYPPPSHKPPPHVKKLRNAGKSVWLDFVQTVRKNADKYTFSREEVSLGLRAWPISKQNPLHEKLLNIQMRFNEAKLDYLPTQKFDKWPGDKVAKKMKIKGQNPIKVEQLWSVYVLLGIGLGSGILVFIIEHVYRL